MVRRRKGLAITWRVSLRRPHVRRYIVVVIGHRDRSSVLIHLLRGVTIILLMLRRHRRRVVVLRRRLHGHTGLHRGRSHVWGIRHRRYQGRASGWLRRVGVCHVARLGLKGRRHAAALPRAIAKLIVRRIAHLVVILIVVSKGSAAPSLGREVASVFTLYGVARFASKVSARLGPHGICV